MDPPQSGLIRKLFIKGRGAEIILPAPHSESPLKIPPRLVLLLAFRILFQPRHENSSRLCQQLNKVSSLDMGNNANIFSALLDGYHTAFEFVLSTFANNCM
jgi:hypothetical protein